MEERKPSWSAPEVRFCPAGSAEYSRLAALLRAQDARPAQEKTEDAHAAGGKE